MSVICPECDSPIDVDEYDVDIGDEFVGVLFRDDEDGELSYNFTMAILDIDLEEG